MNGDGQDQRHEDRRDDALDGTDAGDHHDAGCDAENDDDTTWKAEARWLLWDRAIGHDDSVSSCAVLLSEKPASEMVTEGRMITHHPRRVDRSGRAIRAG